MVEGEDGEDAARRGTGVEPAPQAGPVGGRLGLGPGLHGLLGGGHAGTLRRPRARFNA